MLIELYIYLFHRSVMSIFFPQNHLRLAYEIVCGEHGDVDSTGKYSAEMRNLVNSMLQKDPKKRPSAEEVIQSPVLSERK